MFRALWGQPQATVNRLKSPHWVSSYVTISHASTTTRRRCLRIYVHTSLTLPSDCGVHAVLLLCVFLLSRACIPELYSSRQNASSPQVLVLFPYCGIYASVQFKARNNQRLKWDVFKFIYIFYYSQWGETESTWYCGHYWTIVPAPDDGDCGAICGMKIDRGNRSTRRKPDPTPLCPPHIPYDKNRARKGAAEEGSRRLTAWTMVPCRLNGMSHRNILLCA
jgi:hypothetical protein